MAFTLKNPDGEMSYKQGILIRNLGGGDVRDEGLTQQEASDRIGELMAAKGIKPKGVKKAPKIDYDSIWRKAVEAGETAGNASTPVPMVVSGYEDDPIEGGVCGFAWVNFKMKSGVGRSFGRWLIDEGHARKDDYYGGCTIWISAHGQSMTRKEDNAQALAAVLVEHGIDKVNAMSRMD